MKYIKHLIECKCILPQFKNIPNPPWHKFIVFSQLESDGMVKTSYAQCNNCKVVHRITEVGVSKILNKEVMMTIPTIEDIKTFLPTWLTNLLEKYECELPTWQEAKFIYENKIWGSPVVLVKEQDEDMVFGKYVLILGESLHKVEDYDLYNGNAKT
jgi:hypothetical protein